MQIERQLTSRLPWIAVFTPSIERKFRELNSALNCPKTNQTEMIGLTREAVEEIAYGEFTAPEIAANFIDVLQEADFHLQVGIPPYKLAYILSERGLKLVCYER